MYEILMNSNVLQRIFTQALYCGTKISFIEQLTYALQLNMTKQLNMTVGKLQNSALRKANLAHFSHHFLTVNGHI